MNNFKSAGLSLVLLAWVFSMSALAALNNNTEGAALPRPSVELEPQDVVKIVAEALSNNDEPYANAGIETTFSFASPANAAVPEQAF